MATEFADMAQEVEHVLGKDEVTSSNLVSSSKKPNAVALGFFYACVSATLTIFPTRAMIKKIAKENTYDAI